MTYNEFDYNRNINNRNRGTTERESSEYRRYLEQQVEDAGNLLALSAATGVDLVGAAISSTGELAGLSAEALQSVQVATSIVTNELNPPETAPVQEEGIDFSFSSDLFEQPEEPAPIVEPDIPSADFDIPILGNDGILQSKEERFNQLTQGIVDSGFTSPEQVSQQRQQDQEQSMRQRAAEPSKADDVVRDQFEPRVRNPYQQTSAFGANQLGQGAPAIDEQTRDQIADLFVEGNEKFLAALLGALEDIANSLCSHAQAIDELRDDIRESVT